MADTFVKKPMVVVGTKQQVDAEMGVNDFGIATDVSFYTAEETDAKLADKQDKATAVNYDNITNCITEIPKDIKLEIDSNGYLILKAGSKLYVPNGAGVFDVITVSSDTRMNTTSTGTLILFCRANAVSAVVSGTGKTSSGETDSLAGETYHTWYDTANNFIYRYSADATTPAYKLTLPLAIVTMTTGGICTSIDQVFNGFGYIGSTIFALPGVKGLIPNGRNADGTLKNTTFAVNSVLRITGTGTHNKLPIRLKADEIATGDLNYDETNNYNRHLTSGEIRTYAIVGYINRTSGVVNSLSTKTAFHAVDYNDFKELDNSVVHKTGDETIGGNKTVTGRLLVESVNNEITFSNPDYTAFKGFARRSSAGFIVGTLTDSAWKKYFTFTDNDITSNTPIIYTTTQFAKKNVDTSYIEVDGGTTYINGAYLRLDGKDGPELGGFRLATGNGSKGIMLKGTTSGSLQWDGKEIVREVAQSKAANGYYKFSNGLIVQWMQTGWDGSYTTLRNWPTAFSSATSYKAIAGWAGTTESAYPITVREQTSTGVYLQVYTGLGGQGRNITVIGIGY